MPKRLAARARVAGVPQAQDFALSGLLPPHLRVLLDLHARTALVLDLDPLAPSLLFLLRAKPARFSKKTIRMNLVQQTSGLLHQDGLLFCV